MPFQVPGAAGVVSQLFQALQGGAPSNALYRVGINATSTLGVEGFARFVGGLFTDTDATLAARVLGNMGISATTTNPIAFQTLLGALTDAYRTFPNDRGLVTLNLTDILSGRDGRLGTGLEDNASYGRVAIEFNRLIEFRNTHSANTISSEFSSAPLPTGPIIRIQGVVIDGPLRDAQVFADLNGNGVRDADEPATVTDAFGNYTIDSPSDNVRLVVTGGVDTGTGLPNTLTLTGRTLAGANSSIELNLTPLTTLTDAVAELLANGQPITQSILDRADSIVKAQLGLTGTERLQTINPVSDGGPAALEIFQRGAALANLISGTQSVAALDNSTATTAASIQAPLLNSIAQELVRLSQVNSAAVVDLSNSVSISTFLNQALGNGSVASATLVAGLAAANQQIDNAVSVGAAIQAQSGFLQMVQALAAPAPAPAPAPAVIGEPSASSVTEDVAVVNNNLIASGTIPITDVNSGEAAFSTTVSPAAGNLGSLVLAANGNYTYTVANAATQFLGASQSKIDSFTITSLDGTSKLVSFTINGADEVFMPPVTPATFTPADGSTQGAADASTAITLPGNFVLVGDDEGNSLRVFDRAGGQAVKEIFFGDYLGIGNNELDLEASTQIGNTLYFIGSHGNSSSGADANNREWIFSATLSGTGADTALAFTGRFNGLEAALVAWDQSDAHNKGANFFGFAAGSASGSPESNTGFGIEALTVSPDNGALWIAFRAPVTGGGALNEALIVPITNIAAVLAGTAAPVFGAAIELDLGGRGIRSIEKNADGQYLILAGPTGQASADVADDFRLYSWNGTASGGNATGLVQQAVTLDALLATGASFETIVQVPTNLASGAFVQLLQDDGANMRPGSSTELKDLPVGQQSFIGNWVQLGGAAPADVAGPELVRSSPAADATGVSDNADIVLTFNEPVRAGSGNLVLRSGDTVVATFAANGPGVTYAYNTITLETTEPLQPGMAYTLEIAPGAIVDAVGNAFAELAGNQALGFSTIPAPPAGGGIATGDIAFVAFNSDAGTGEGVDAFAFVLLKDLAAGTSIRFTDREWTGSSFNTGEADFVWTASSNLSAGTVVTIQPDQGPSGTASTGLMTGEGGGLSRGGEQIFAITGTADANPGSFIAAIGLGAVGGLVTTGANLNQTSFVPDGLTLGETAVNLAFVNGRYTGPTIGSADALRSAINTVANWTNAGDNTPTPVVGNALQLGGNFNVQGPTVLAPNDVLFLAVNGDAPDAFAFTFLQDIAQGTQIGFTDRDYSGSGFPASGETAYLWTTDRAYTAGTVVTIQTEPSTTANNGNPVSSHGTVQGTRGGINTTAETIYAFQGNIDGLGSGTAGAITLAAVLGAINVGGAAAGTIPDGLLVQTFAFDNVVYAGSFNLADLPAFEATVRNTTNWTGSDTVVSPLLDNALVFPGAVLAPVNDAPTGTDGSVRLDEDSTYTFAAADFGFTDTADNPANTLAAVKFSSLPANGSLSYNNAAITPGQVNAGFEVSAADIAAGLLRFTPAPDANGDGYASFAFQVRDNGGVVNGGRDLDPVPNTLTLNVTPIDDNVGGNPTALSAGDVVFLAVNADAPDAFAFTFLQDIGAGTQIGFTDRNGVAAGDTVTFTAINESAFVWTANQAYSAGTVVTIQTDSADVNGNPVSSVGSTQGAGGGISPMAETYYAFQGSINGLANGAAGAPITVNTFLASINLGSGPAGDIPAALAGFAQTFGPADNIVYAGGFDLTDLGAFAASVRNTANWNGSDDVTAPIVNNAIVFPAPQAPGVTLISAIQGEGDASALVGDTVTVQARVTAWVSGQNLFYLMEESADRDGNALTSEGIAVAYTGTSPVDANSIGDIVRLSGVVAESFGQTQISYTASSLTAVFDGTTANLEAPRVVTLPIASESTLERFEGELITVQSSSGNALFVADTFTFARFGETTLYADAVPFQFSEVNAPSVTGNAAYLDFLARNSIQLDDGSSAQNPTLAQLNAGTRILRDNTDDGMANGTALGADAMGNVNFIRAGDTAGSVTGVLGFSFGAYELLPTETVALTAAPRPTGTPDVGAAEVKVASFNVLNYFTTLGATTFTNPAGVVHEGRGATNAAEFTQQEAKIVAAMLATGAHVFGLNELQNNGDAGAIASLVNALNAASTPGRFAAIGGHANGTDAIRVGIIYDQTVVQPLGLAVTPNTATYGAFAAQSRLPVAQTFGYLADDSKQFTLVVNHLKSKGGTGTGADADQGDGQGQFAATRLLAAQQLAQWLDTNPTGATDGDYLLIGDLNSYRQENTVTYLESQGYSVAADPGDYSYIFDGLRGSLDHILTRNLGTEITGFSHVNINADEQIALDYNDEFGDGSVNVALDRNDQYRSSDHDPVVIGLRLNSEMGSPTPPPPDVIVPTLAANTPADNAINVAAGANIVLTFSENVRAGTGNIVLNAIDASVPDLTIDVNSAQVSINGNVVTINPLADLQAEQAYAVQLASGVIEDLAGNDFAGFVDNTTLNFTTAVGRPYFSLAGGNFMEDWTDTTRISVNDSWSGVPFIVGYRGDALSSASGTDPQTVLGSTPEVIDVNANQTDPNTFATGGVAEFQITNPVVALQGSGTADAPNLVLYVNATGRQNITVSYNLRDIDGAVDNVIQQVALQYRIGDTGNFVNVPAACVTDASTGPSLATLVTAVSAVLPAAANGASELQIRVITNDAVGSDEWIGIDDIVVSSQAVNQAPTLDGVPALAEAITAGVAAPLADFTVADIDTANLTVTLTPTNGVLNGLTDADAAPGVQLIGTASSINTDIATATFTATAAGDASFGISVSDGLALPVTATYNFSATPAALPPAVASTGSIAFLGFNADSSDGFAFVAVDELAAGQVIYFREDEWNGSTFADANEGTISWTNSSGAAIAAGTVVELVNLSTGTLSANVGSALNLAMNRQNLNASDEVLYAYTSTETQATGTFTFLAAFASGGYSATNGLLTGTSLTTGSTAVEFTNDFDVFAYNAGTAPTMFTGRSNALSNFNNPANWVFQDGGGNQDTDSTSPDAPFLTDPQSPLEGVTFVGIAGTTEMV